MQRWDYELIRDAYLSSGGFENGSYIEPFPRETLERVQKRRKLALQINLVRRITLSLVGHLFRKSPIRNVESKAYQRFMEDTDTKRTDIDAFMKKVFRLGLLYGTVFILIDKSQVEVRTQKEKELLRAFPYAVIRLPWHLENYKTDHLGKLTEITFKEETEEGKQIYRTFTDSEWIISTDPFKENVILSGTHNLGEVPVVVYSPVPSDTEILSPPLMLEIAKIQKAIYNLLSELQSVLRDTSFPVFTFPVGSPEDIEKLEKETLTLGTENAIAYTPQGSAKPEFIAPPPEPANQLLETIKFLIEKAYEHANLNFQGGVQKSGIAKEYEYLEFSKMLSDFAQGLEECEYRIAHLVSRWEDEEFSGWIEYSKSFTPLDVEKRINTILQILNDPNVPQEVKIELVKVLTRYMLSDTHDEQRLKELDRIIESQEDFEQKLREEWNSTGF